MTFFRASNHHPFDSNKRPQIVDQRGSNMHAMGPAQNNNRVKANLQVFAFCENFMRVAKIPDVPT